MASAADSSDYHFTWISPAESCQVTPGARCCLHMRRRDAGFPILCRRGGLAYFNTWRTKTMKCILRLSAWALLTGAAATGIAAADEISDWNQMLLQAMLTNPVTPAPLTMRPAAIVEACRLRRCERNRPALPADLCSARGAAGNIRSSGGRRGRLYGSGEPLSQPEGQIRPAAHGFSGGHHRHHRCSQTGIVLGADGGPGDSGVAQPGRILGHCSAIPWGNAARPVAAHTAGHGPGTRAAIGDHHSVGDPLSFAVPHRRPAGHDQRPVYGRL